LTFVIPETSLILKRFAANIEVSMKTFVKDIWIDFVSLFYPRYCFACGEGLAKGEETICSRCMLELPRSNYHVEIENPLFKRLDGRIPIQHAFSFFLFRKGGKVQHVLHALKYDNHPEIGEMLGEVYGEELRLAGYDVRFDLIIPVPLHATRKRTRGYNQSEEFAKGLSKSLNIETSSGLLIRTIKTESQTRKTKLKRWQNVSDVFKVTDPEQIFEKRILLVDDVITTGATIEACANVLLGSGCKSISLGSIAYAETK
jgi:ComF family protein